MQNEESTPFLQWKISRGVGKGFQIEGRTNKTARTHCACSIFVIASVCARQLRQGLLGVLGSWRNVSMDEETRTERDRGDGRRSIHGVFGKI
eukprot:scaffold1318_cov362-Pavlova_lutheri.AAC.10